MSSQLATACRLLARLELGCRLFATPGESYLGLLANHDDDIAGALLPTEDEDVSAAVAAAFRESGIEVHVRGRKSIVLDRPSMLAQIRLFGVGHGVGKRASPEKRLAVSRVHDHVGRTPSPPAEKPTACL